MTTLDDFFTLDELKNGLKIPSRVDELISAMRHQNNTGNLTLQLSTLAHAVAATENDECLDLFLHSDGFSFITKWLQDVHISSCNKDEASIEAPILASLKALEKLKVPADRLFSSELKPTLERLLGHSSLQIQGIARRLLQSWKQETSEEDASVQANFEEVGEGKGDIGMVSAAILSCGADNRVKLGVLGHDGGVDLDAGDVGSSGNCGGGGNGSEGSDDGAEFPSSDMGANVQCLNQCRRRSGSENMHREANALEVATQVSREVEKEVEDYSEKSSSYTTEKHAESDQDRPASPDSVCRELVPHDEALHDAGTQQGASQSEAENDLNCSSLVTELAEEPGSGRKGTTCGLDLNQEICVDDMEDVANPYGGIALNEANKKMGCLDIDLNVPNDGAEGTVALNLEKIPVSSGIYSVESTQNIVSRKSERVHLDLNRTVGDAHSCLSPAYSSSIRSSLRNFDLNDVPPLPDGSLDQTQNSVTRGSSKPSEDEFCIMGTRIKVGIEVGGDSNDPKWKILNATMGADVARRNGAGLSVPYLHNSFVGHLESPSTMLSSIGDVSGAHGLDALIPYAVDPSRAASLMTQFMVPPSVISPYPHPNIFTGAHDGLNGVTYSKPVYNMNYGLSPDMRGCDAGPFFMASNSGPTEHLRPHYQFITHGTDGKRKEPDTGWEPCAVPNKYTAWS